VITETKKIKVTFFFKSKKISILILFRDKIKIINNILKKKKEFIGKIKFKKKEITPRKNNEDSKLKNKLLLSIFILNLFKIELLKKLPIIEIKNIKKI
jgi:hypothetical protein